MDTPTPRIQERTLIKTQAISGLVFATFLVLHLTNTLTALSGQSSFDGAITLFRKFYQLPIIEIGVIGAALIHMWAGLTRGLRRRRRAKERGEASAPSLRVRFHRLSGYYLLLAFAGHVVATRGPGLFFDLPAEMNFLTYSLSTYGWFFYPYYVGLFASGAFHLINGALVALRMLKVRVPKPLLAASSKPFWAAAGVLAVVGALAVLAMGGNLYEVDTARFAKYDALYEQLLGFKPGR